MLVREAGIKVEKSGDFETSGFKIKASAKAFRILSEQLYSNKLLAIVRELSCNAQDSHIAANKSTVPFLVHAPNSLEPWFSIRDYGIGLSHEDVMHVYTTYFESTKTSSNDYTGCLGLGSKTPFAYTDMFSVTSFFNGIRREYSAYIGNEGFPCISLLTEETTTEENGLLVQLGIEQKDFPAINDIISKIYTYFINTPKIIGQNITVKTPEKFLEANSWYRAKVNGTNISQSMAVMGNVAYPINPGSFDYNELNTVEKSILGCNIHIHFNIGELEITPSREHLSYDKVTKRAIKEKLAIIKGEMINLIKDKVNQCKNGWEKACLYFELINNSEYSGIRHIVDAKDILGDCETSLYVSEHDNLKGIILHYVIKKYSGKKKYSSDTSNVIHKSNDTVLYYDDLKDKTSSGRAGYKAYETGKSLTLISCSDAQLLELIKALDCDPSIINKVSDLPIPPKTTYIKAGTIQAYIFDNGAFKEEKVDLNIPALYVKVYRNSVESDYIDSYLTMRSAQKHISAIKKRLNITMPVYGLRVSNIEKLKGKKYNNVGWKDFFQVATEEVSKLGNSIQKGITASIDESSYNDMRIISGRLKDPDHIITKFCEKVKLYVELSKNFEDIKNDLRILKGFKTTEEPFDYKTEIDPINKLYPIVNYMLQRWGWKEENILADIINYIQLKDKK